MPEAKWDPVARGHVFTACIAALFAVVVFRSAWIHDDAYITFRTVDNFIHGYGLRWNVVERVQTYTHPLWMLLVSACYAITREMYFTVLGVSLVLSMAAVYLVAFGTARSTAAACLGVIVLASSSAFVDYSTSGLENPLTHVLSAAFLVLWFTRDMSPRLLGALAAIAALGAVNRMDTLLLYLPMLGYGLLQVPWRRGMAALGCGILPLVLWVSFSLLYYGFIFPNTAYAKLFAAGVSGAELARHGGYYFQNSARHDPVTLLAIGAGIVLGLSSRDRRQAAVVGGLVAYLAYIVYIGGDFVSGRFLSAPLLGAVAVLTRQHLPSRARVAVLCGVVLVAGLMASDPPLLRTAAAGSQGRPLMDAHGIADERAYYYPYSGLLRALQGVTVASHPWARAGLEARHRTVRVEVRGDIGYFGFHAGPAVHVIDVWGLADPLIARLPARTDVRWRIGHFTRTIPAGYTDTLVTGHNQIADRDIATLYDRLALITRAPLFDPHRLAAIWESHLGTWSGDGRQQLP
jgi:arabinofuranosyltransferase